MARIGRRPCLGLVILVAAAAARAADPPADPQAALTATLAVQDAMRHGRECLQQGQARAAVDLLEAQLPRINGNPAYLALLREAYYAYVKELELAQQDDLGAVYRKRLSILDQSPGKQTAPSSPNPAEARAAAQAPPVARGVRAEDDPLQQPPRRSSPAGRAVLPEAEKAFADKHYREADALFARAYGADPADPQHAPQWAYCKLYAVVGRLKEAEAGGTPIPAAELEREVTAALKLAADDPKLAAFGRQVMDAVRQRATAPAATVTVRHQDKGPDGWARAESPNFRLFHTQPKEFAEQVLRAAEQARLAAAEKWGGTRGEWKPACDVYLYPTAAEYAKKTGKAADSPGHATYQVKDGTVIGRRLDLRADEPNLLAAVVPHETTHLVLGDLFADGPPPRWADEGMAVLAEPRSRVDRYARTLSSNRRQGRLVPLDKLFAKADYPDAALITVFYVESVSVVDFLVAEKGPQEFVRFVRDVTKTSLESALQQHYDCRSVVALQERWLVRTFAAAGARPVGGLSGQ